ncbi:ABC transporter substrate-binding protein [Martelella sp. HB161492]|uniref:ABC transporter substrate-binding protein n=1 Tax=Martelella sp. HB161492 TaxID=2720726 RepID=UPI0015920650|nr:ABC transporter substrate-binding protein [Martelella sp. HB161492]
MKKMMLAAAASATLFGLAGPLAAQDATEKTVAITYIVEHPALDAVREGIVAGLADAGFTEGKNLKVVARSAQGNMTTQTQIADEFAGLKPDVAVGISTPSAQALKASMGDSPVVFAAVTDPVAAGLVTDKEKPEANITGTSDQQDYAPMLSLIKTLLPEAKKIGVIYNPGEANSVAQVDGMKAVGETMGFTIVDSPAAQSTMVPDAARNLVGKADAILLPTDNSVISVLEAIITVGERAKLPVFTSDTESVERGAVAALGFNYGEMGKVTGKMVADILNGTPIADIPVVVPGNQDLYLNMKAAAGMGVTIPDDVKASAKKVIE